MKRIAILFAFVLCTSGLISSQTRPTKSKRKQAPKPSSTTDVNRPRSTVGLDFCSVVNDGRGGVWLTGNAFLLAGLMINDRNGIVSPQLVSDVRSICKPIFVTAEVGWMINGGSLYRTSNEGLSWVKSTIPGLSTMNTLHFLDLQNGWVGGEAGEIYRTTDGGESWKTARVPLKYHIQQILFVDNLYGWAIGSVSVSLAKRMRALFRTGDGGETWQLLSHADADAKGTVESVFFLDHQNGWGIEGWQHNVIRTQDGGKTWTIKELYPKSRWNSVFFIDDLHGWVVGKGIAHTSDGGITWEYQVNPETSRMNFNGIRFIDAKRGWAIAYDKVLRTLDGGRTWLALSNDWQQKLPLDTLLKGDQSTPRN